MRTLVVIGLLICAASANVKACNKGQWAPSSAVYPFSLMPLPYSYNFFEPYISSAIVAAHHDHHHQAYVNSLNAYIATTPSLGQTTLLSLLQNNGSNIAVQKFGGGDFNHNMLWWELTSPSCASGAPTGNLAAKINLTFGNFSNFQTQFQTASLGLFGSGWAWLCQDSSNNLIITTTANQANPLMTNTCNPIIGSDLWEHAYYLQYMYNKAAYFANFWNVVDWVQVGYFYDTYVSLGNPIPF